MKPIDSDVITSRKRARSTTECAFVGQSKMYINENIANASDDAKMKQIYSKTVNLLFKGSSALFSELHHNNTAPDPVTDKERLKFVQLLGGGLYKTINGGKSSIVPDSPDRRCVCCTRESRLHGECCSCNLELCENCGFSCVECNEPLCSNCVTLFDCGTTENPCCGRCKIYY